MDFDAASRATAPCLSIRTLRCLIAVAICVAASDVRAQMFTVGVGENCSTDSIQAAINAASDGYEIRIARDQAYAAQALDLNGKDLRLVGGYDTCEDGSPSGQTLLSGLGGGADSVLTIRGSALVEIENLAFIRGDEVYDGYGGGIDYRGTGLLALTNTALTQNYAGYGGGLSVISEGGGVAVVIDTGTVVQLNQAQFSGGGIRIQGDVYLRMTAPDSALLNNVAIGIDPANGNPRFGNGGGLQVLAPARADIGSPGIGLSGPIAGNTARYGGGIAIDGLEGVQPRSNAVVRVFTTDRNRATRIHGNRATQTGGGIHLLPEYGSFTDPVFSSARVCLWDVRLDDNRAQNGAALYADASFEGGGVLGSDVEFNSRSGEGNCSSRPLGLGAVACNEGVPCNTIEGNRSVDGADAPTSGSTLLFQDEVDLVVKDMRVRRNEGGALIRMLDPTFAELRQLLLADNVLSGRVLQIDAGGSDVSLDLLTIAGNAMSGAVISASGSPTLRRSLIWQPGTTVASPASLAVQSVIAHEISSLGGGPEALVYPPRFVDPDYGDYRLQAGSPAVDFAPDDGSGSVDLDGGDGVVDLPVKVNFRGARDAGAFERQDAGNLVMNPSFPARSETPPDHFRRWSVPAPTLASWSEAEGAPGSPGAVYVSFRPGIDPDPGRGAKSAAVAYTGLRQCIALPGSAIYGVSSWSRVPGATVVSRDYARIRWTLRRDGADCVGAVSAEGDHYLARSSAWSVAPEAQIPLAPGDWTVNSTLEIALQVLDGDVNATNAIDAWFDNVTLRVVNLEVPRVFRDGFEDD